jgi:hypothetical protein
VTDPYPTGVTSERTTGEAPQASVGELVSQISGDLSTLVRQEIALARAEMTQEAKKAGKAGGLLGGAGFAAYLLALFASFAVAHALDEVMPLWAAFAIVAAVYGVIALVLYTRGRKQLKTVDPTPHQTIETLKEMR